MSSDKKLWDKIQAAQGSDKIKKVAWTTVIMGHLIGWSIVLMIFIGSWVAFLKLLKWALTKV